MRTLIGKFYRNALPGSMQARLDCWRAKRAWLSQAAIFIHVPKAAGFSISHALYGKALGHIRAKDIQRYAKPEFDCCFKFAFVRHPVSRYISALSYIRENHSELKGGPGLPPEALLALEPVEFLDQWLAKETLEQTNFVFQPQADFVCGERDTILVDHLARYEDFDQEIQWLSERLPRLNAIQALNASHSHQVAYSFEEVNVRLRKIYPRDYALFGYE